MAQVRTNVRVAAPDYVHDIVLLSNNYREMQDLLDGEPLEDIDKLKYLGSMVVSNGQGTEEISNRITLARSAFSRGVKY